MRRCTLLVPRYTPDCTFTSWLGAGGNLKCAARHLGALFPRGETRMCRIEEWSCYSKVLIAQVKKKQLLILPFLSWLGAFLCLFFLQSSSVFPLSLFCSLSLSCPSSAESRKSFLQLSIKKLNNRDKNIIFPKVDNIWLTLIDFFFFLFFFWCVHMCVCVWGGEMFHQEKTFWYLYLPVKERNLNWRSPKQQRPISTAPGLALRLIMKSPFFCLMCRKSIWLNTFMRRLKQLQFLCWWKNRSFLLWTGEHALQRNMKDHR